MGVREKYEEKVDAQLHEWQEWIESYTRDPYTRDLHARDPSARDLHARDPSARDPMESDPQDITERQRRLGKLEDCQQIAQDCLEELRSSEDKHWELAKQAVERAMIDLKRMLDESGTAHSGRSLSLQTSRSYVYSPFSKRG
jgi:hypothetical protein